MGAEQKSNRKRKFERGICSQYDFIIRLLISTVMAAVYFIILYFKRDDNTSFIKYMMHFANFTSRIGTTSLVGLNFAQYFLVKK